MRIRTKRWPILGLVLLAVACGRSSPPPESKTTAETPPPAAAPAAPTGQELNQAIQQPLDRAKAVEGDVLKDQQQTDQQIDDSGA